MTVNIEKFGVYRIFQKFTSSLRDSDQSHQPEAYSLEYEEERPVYGIVAFFLKYNEDLPSNESEFY
jgi:hypothetical protein